MPDETQEESYGLDVMAASVLPIYRDPTSSLDPEEALLRIKKVYESGQGKWSKEAEDAFAEDISRIKKASGTKYDISVLDTYDPPPEPDPSKPEETNLAAIDKWKEDTTNEAAKNSGSDWLFVKDQAEDYLDKKARAYKQYISGANTGWLRDKIDRGLNAGLAFSASAIPGVDTREMQKDLGDYFDTNPKYNEDAFSRYAEALGQGGIQMALPAGAGIITGAATGNPIIGGAVWAGLGAAINGSAAYNETWNNIYDETGDTDAATVGAIERTFSETTLEALGDTLIAGKVLQPWVKGLSAANKAKVIAGAVSKKAQPIWKRAVKGFAGAASVAVPTEFVTEFAQSVGQQTVEGQYTGKPIDYSQAIQEGKYGAAVGFVFGGGAGAITHAAHVSTDDIADAVIEKSKQGKVLNEDGSAFVDEESGDFDADLDSGILDTKILNRQKEAEKTTEEAAPKTLQEEADALGEPLERPKTTLKKTVPVTESAQPELAGRAEQWSESEQAGPLTLQNVAPADVPPGLLHTLSKGKRYIIRAKEAPNGTILTKEPVIPDAVQTTAEAVETEQEVTPNAEEERRVATYPNKISQLKAKLSKVPTRESLRQKINDLGKMIAALDQKVIENWSEVNPELRKVKKATLDKNKRTLTSMLKEAIDQFKNYDLIVDEKNRIAHDIEETQLKYDLARDFNSKPSQVFDIDFYESPAKLREILDLVRTKTPEELDAKLAELKDIRDRTQSTWEAASTMKAADEKSKAALAKESESRADELDKAIRDYEGLKRIIDFLKTNSAVEIENALAVRAMSSEKPSQVKEKEGKAKTKKATPTKEEVEATPQLYIQQSRSTGAVFTQGISNALRNSINYWLGGFGLRNVAVMTRDEFESGAFNGLFSKDFRNILKAIDEQKALTGAGGVFHTNADGTKGVMILKDGSFNKDAFVKASHELGHGVERMLLKNAPADLKKQILGEYYEAVNQIKRDLKNKTIKSVRDVADAMIGVRAEGSPYNTEAAFRGKTLSDVEKEYIIGTGKDFVGASEWQANRIMRYVHNPSAAAKGRTDKLYKGIGDILRKLWSEVASRFKDAPTLNSWLDSHWSDQRANLMFYPGATETNTKGEPNYVQRLREIRINKAIKEAPEGASISEQFKRFKRDKVYTQQNREIPLRKAYDAIHEKNGENFDNILNSFFDNDGTIPESERAIWGVQLIEELQRRELEATSKKDKKLYADVQNEIFKQLDTEGRSKGQFTESLKLLYDFTLTGRAHYFYNELNAKSKATTEGTPPVWEFEKIRDSIAKYFEAEKVAPDGIIRNALHEAEAKEIHKAHGNPSSPNATWNYWYGNILSGLATQWVNTQFSLLDTALRAITYSMAHPFSTPAVVRGLKRGMAKGSIEGLGAGRGRLLRHLDKTRVAELVRNKPYVNWKDRWYAGAEKIANIFLTIQQYFPFRFLAASDTFWRRAGTELQAQAAATDYVLSKLDSLKDVSLETVQKNFVEAENNLQSAKIAQENAAKIKSPSEIKKAETRIKLADAEYKEALVNLEIKSNEAKGVAHAVSEVLHNSDEAWDAAVAQAEKDWTDSETRFEKAQDELEQAARNEGKKFERATFPIKPTKNDINLRALEIIDEQRKISNPEIYEAAERAGAWTNLTAKPEGLAGALADTIKTFVGKVPLGKIAFPFINVTSNILTRTLDFTPIGIGRALGGMPGMLKIVTGKSNIMKEGLKGRPFFNPETRTDTVMDAATGLPLLDKNGNEVKIKRIIPWSPLESKQRLMAGLMGTGALALMAGLAAKHLDDKDPEFAVFGSGPKDRTQREQWIAEGGIPYSFKFGNRYIKYAETPFAVIAGWLGKFSDAYRWDKSFNRKKVPEQFLYSGILALQVAGDMGVLRSVKDVMDSIWGNRSPAGTALNPIKGLIPYKALFADIAKITDPYKTDPSSAKAIMLSGLPGLQTYALGGARPDLNAFGEPLPRNLAERFTSKANEDRAWMFLARNDLHIPGLPGSIIIGEGQGKEKVVYGSILEQRKKALGRMAYNVLTSEEAYELQKRSGKEIKKAVLAIARDKEVKNPEEYQKYINKVTEDVRRKIKLQILAESFKKIKRGESF